MLHRLLCLLTDLLLLPIFVCGMMLMMSGQFIALMANALGCWLRGNHTPSETNDTD